VPRPPKEVCCTAPFKCLKEPLECLELRYKQFVFIYFAGIGSGDSVLSPKIQRSTTGTLGKTGQAFVGRDLPRMYCFIQLRNLVSVNLYVR
jgi:hypothetical protein